MEKIHIEIRDGIDPKIALSLVTRVVAVGRISKGENGKMYYCWGTVFDMPFDVPNGEIMVSVRQYRKTDCFVVHKNGK